MFNLKCANKTADEHLAELMPIFERLRAQEQIPCVYPLHMGAGGTAFIRGGSSRSTPLCPYAPHCHPSTHWVREKSARSVAMSRPSRSSLSASTPDSLSDNESSLGVRYTPRFTSGGSKPNSRPGSKPPSRHGSSLSLDSTDDATPSRIPQRRLGSTTPSGSSQRPSRLSVTGSTITKVTGSDGISAFGSTIPRARTPSNSASPAPTRNGSISRSSSIPTLVSGIPTSRSRIPISVRQKSMDKQSPMTPSQPSTPGFGCSSTGRNLSGNTTPSGMRTPRKPSVEPPSVPSSERKGSRGTTSSSSREPFRL